ncbi:MAG: hypothetical protein ACOZF0_10310 [Thermodesulfobacteriota bacterium]
MGDGIGKKKYDSTPPILGSVSNQLKKASALKVGLSFSVKIGQYGSNIGDSTLVIQANRQQAAGTRTNSNR